jgi:epsin
MDMLDKRLNDKGKNWRHVLKALKVLDYCLHEGSEMVVTWGRQNIYIIKTLREFIYIDEEGRDVGQNGAHSLLSPSSSPPLVLANV